ncbi:MAG: hypothetical protein KDA22_04060 [Phycisphaerales bacterium]|nr:hypothetical protein [Phycisphaerales bacterium]
MPRPEPSFRFRLVLEQQLSLDELSDVADLRVAYAALLKDILADPALAEAWEARPLPKDGSRPGGAAPGERRTQTRQRKRMRSRGFGGVQERIDAC